MAKIMNNKTIKLEVGFKTSFNNYLLLDEYSAPSVQHVGVKPNYSNLRRLYGFKFRNSLTKTNVTTIK